MTAESSRRCHICRKSPAVGREHLPAKAASNRGRVRVKYIDGANVGDGIRHNYAAFGDGFWVQALCEKCNQRRTGARLGGPYADFVSQISDAAGIEDERGRIFVRLDGVYTLRVIKQMFSMFLCAMPQQPLPEWRGIQQFVLGKEDKLPANAPQVYLYRNASEVGRIVPWCAIAEILTRREPIALSEISWPPVGLIFCDRPDERFALMANVTQWGQYGFKDRKSFVLQLPRLKVNTDHPLAYGTVSEIKRWRTQCGVVWAVAGADYDASPNNTSMVWQRD
jgi:hypothetical protein